MRRRKRLIGLGIGLVLLAAALVVLRFGIAGRDPTWARIQETGVWRVGMDPSFPPFENLDALGQPAGFDVDLARAIAVTWGVRAEIVGVGFDELLDAVHAHRIDSALSALPVVPHRTQDVTFSAPYMEAGLLLVALPGGDVQSLEDLGGRRVAAEWGARGDAEARALGRQLDGDLTLVLRESAPAALDALLAGDADAALVDAISLATYAQRDQLVAVDPPVTSNPYVIVVPRDAPQLLRAVDAALVTLAADGTLDEIREKWLRPGE